MDPDYFSLQESSLKLEALRFVDDEPTVEEERSATKKMQDHKD
jgi:hypothetical protein